MNLKILTVVTAFFAASGCLKAQVAANASANIITALECTNASGEAGDLEFGYIVAGGSESIVHIAPESSGSRSLSSGDATLVTSDQRGSAQFDLTGLSGAMVEITVDASVTLNNGSSSTMMMVPEIESAALTLSGGIASFYVGGNLFVGANQPIGYYEGTFNVTAEYQ